jgi:hypothetical protein
MHCNCKVKNTWFLTVPWNQLSRLILLFFNSWQVISFLLFKKKKKLSFFLVWHAMTFEAKVFKIDLAMNAALLWITVFFGKSFPSDSKCTMVHLISVFIWVFLCRTMPWEYLLCLLQIKNISFFSLFKWN